MNEKRKFLFSSHPITEHRLNGLIQGTIPWLQAFRRILEICAFAWSSVTAFCWAPSILVPTFRNREMALEMFAGLPTWPNNKRKVDWRLFRIKIQLNQSRKLLILDYICFFSPSTNYFPFQIHASLEFSLEQIHKFNRVIGITLTIELF